MIIETAHAYYTTGTLHSRKGLLYGPFCPIYGVGAVILIPIISKFKKNNILLFIAGFFIGGIFEYITSFVLESMYGIRWWNYYQFPLNLNGRICFLYNIFWGIISLVLLRIFKPCLDYCFKRIPHKIIKPITYTLLVFFIFNTIMTVMGIKIFINRTIKNYSLNVFVQEYKFANENNLNSSFDTFLYSSYNFLSDNIFTDEKITKTFPNINIKDKTGNIIYLKQVIEN